MNKGLTMLELLIYTALVLIVGALIYGLDNAPNVENVDCEHEYVVSSKYNYLRGQYKTISKCAKCGYEI